MIMCVNIYYHIRKWTKPDGRKIIEETQMHYGDDAEHKCYIVDMRVDTQMNKREYVIK